MSSVSPAREENQRPHPHSFKSFFPHHRIFLFLTIVKENEIPIENRSQKPLFFDQPEEGREEEMPILQTSPPPFSNTNTATEEPDCSLPCNFLFFDMMPDAKLFHNYKKALVGQKPPVQKKQRWGTPRLDWFVRSEQGWRLVSCLPKEYFMFCLIWWHIFEVAPCERFETVALCLDLNSALQVQVSV